MIQKNEIAKNLREIADKIENGEYIILEHRETQNTSMMVTHTAIMGPYTIEVKYVSR